MADQKPNENQNSEFYKPKDPKDVEKAQEECMKKQYQMKSNWPPVSGHSALLQKRLAKGVCITLWIIIYLISYVAK
ncbi:cAMP-regulated phosphoprotein 19-B [Aphis craccivora]|uniref:cAMP-regulated phosphoprotein 19-B n=1 Tax=Aphis craccivora TaxID=307492 RepID=A0A6G0YJM3_APHCR|nr:cAMP-regulated phosphoprotein 19-B [Aphis craccivora]